MLTAIVGINWGDEGKGRMVDLLAKDYQLIIRYQGGNNAGHTVINEQGRFVLNLLPSGILRAETVNVLGNGMVLDLAHLGEEISRLQAQGIAISPERLKISDKAVICLPYHRLQDNLEEDRLGAAQAGSTRRGIGPVYGDKYLRKALRMSDLLATETLYAKVEALAEWKNLHLQQGYGAAKIEAAEVYAWLLEHGAPLQEYICDTTLYLSEAIRAGRDLLFEAQLGALRDIDFGIYPYTSSSSTIAAYAPIGAGVPFARLDKVIGITKAYSSAVGEGPFVAEFFGAEAAALREAGAEYGAATGRPRRVGGFDLVASRYGCLLQGASELALTKLDILAGLPQIPVCTAYQIDGQLTRDFPTGDRLLRAKPVYEYLPGFAADISACRRAADLPAAALAYIQYIETQMGVPVRYVSVGPAREDYLIMPE